MVVRIRAEGTETMKKNKIVPPLSQFGKHQSWIMTTAKASTKSFELGMHKPWGVTFHRKGM